MRGLFLLLFALTLSEWCSRKLQLGHVERAQSIISRREYTTLIGLESKAAVNVLGKPSQPLQLVRASLVEDMRKFFNLLLNAVERFRKADVVSIGIRLRQQRVVQRELRIEAQRAIRRQKKSVVFVIARANMMRHEASQTGDDDAIII